MESQSPFQKLSLPIEVVFTPLFVIYRVRG